ncbi:hypothetical protein CANINC_002801 [Pichia inconspicua]|uniref:Protein phosphatase methylesterase 1 n=1 Tax=Pichia inconspicua TaxID=52247 RepID=A0A4T0X0C0_9ASCO|nr:hypothetical protein CANINC_002801 [[Candida] inconspicua]
MIEKTYTSPDTNYTFQTYYSPPKHSTLVFVAHHGAGSSSQSFRLFQQSLESSDPIVIPGLFLFDMRGHANTNLLNQSNVDSNYNLSINQLIDDFAFLIEILFKKINKDAKVCLIGHSLGGSVLTKYLLRNSVYNSHISGLVVVDIVEELAISSLPVMESYLCRLPSSFDSVDSVIQYYIDHGQISNRNSLNFSIPPLVKQNATGAFEFVIDLKRTKPYWFEWFKDLSRDFISIPNSIAKLLILANNNYLDKHLIIGQMQGKFQLVVLNNTGHFIQEDIPHNFTQTILDFVERNDYEVYHRSNSSLSTNAIMLNKFNEIWKSKQL